MPLTSARPLVFPALWGHERTWFVIDPSAPDTSAVRKDFVAVAAKSQRSAWRRIGAIVAGWATFGACTAAIPITWAALAIPVAWVPVAAIAAVIASVAAIVLGGGAYTALAGGTPPRTPHYIEALPDFVVSWADDATAEEVLLRLATAANRIVGLRESYFSEPLVEALGSAHWIADDVLEPAMLDAWRRELSRISAIAPDLVIPSALNPPGPPALPVDPSIAE